MFYKKIDLALLILIAVVGIVFIVSYVSAIQKDMYPDGSGTWSDIDANTAVPATATAAASVSKWSAIGGTMVSTWTRARCRSTLSTGQVSKGTYTLFSTEGEKEINGKKEKVSAIVSGFTGGCLDFLSGEDKHWFKSINEAPGGAQTSVILDPPHFDGNADTEYILWGPAEAFE